MGKIKIWFDKELRLHQIEANIKYPENIISIAFEYYLMCLKGIKHLNFSKIMKEIYEILREHPFKERKMFPENYIETIISKIQEKCRQHYQSKKERYFKFDDNNEILSYSVKQLQINNAYLEAQEVLIGLKFKVNETLEPLKKAMKEANDINDSEELLKIALKNIYG